MPDLMIIGIPGQHLVCRRLRVCNATECAMHERQSPKGFPMGRFESRCPKVERQGLLMLIAMKQHRPQNCQLIGRARDAREGRFDFAQGCGDIADQNMAPRSADMERWTPRFQSAGAVRGYGRISCSTLVKCDIAG